MFPTLLLLTGSLTALVTSVLLGRAKSGAYDSPLLQKENWIGYILLSAGLAVASLYRFSQFNRNYEFEHNHRLGLDYFGIDLAQPLPLIYGMLTVGAICYFAWMRRRRKSEWPRTKKRIVLEVAVLTFLTGTATFGCLVWPTPWRYRTELVDQSDLEGSFHPLTYKGQGITEFRENRITGEEQVKMGDHWEHGFGFL